MANQRLEKKNSNEEVVSGLEDPMDDDQQDVVCLLAKDDDDQSLFLAEEKTVSQPELPGWQRRLLTPLLPDDRFCITEGTPLLDGVVAVRLLKFVALTWLGLLSMFCVVRWLDFEHDETLRVSDMIVYDGHVIVMDAMFFFWVGRLHQQRGVDHLAWMLMACAGGSFASLETKFTFLQHSVTLYDMHCTWPWKLWVFVAIVIPLCAVVVIWHIQHAAATNRLVLKAVEMSTCVVLFMIPPMTSPYFHFHHWFAGWLVGMHANYDIWWSRLAMAWCWGCYMNGIAVYGRDPITTCGYSFYLSAGGHCPYLDCYIDAYEEWLHGNHTDVDYAPMEAHDWRNCSVEDGSYLP